jgi:hypothetical protein
MARAETLGDEHLDRPADQLIARVPEHPLDLVIDEHDPAVGVGDEHSGGAQLDRESEETRVVLIGLGHDGT